MSFAISTEKKYMSYDTVEQFMQDHRRIIHTIMDSPVIEFDIGDKNGCLEYFMEHIRNVPMILNTRRLTYFGKLAHFLVYNLALSAEFPQP